ncbi:MAG: glgB [Clostridia bacterium]|nr:glgB [Clostridia bacterium]
MEYGQSYYLPEEYIKEYIKKAYKVFKDYQYLGAHFMEYEAMSGISFMVLAPHAEKVHLVGQFNAWNGENHPMKRIENAGIWHIFICGLEEMHQYKYQIYGMDKKMVFKSDPYGFYSQIRPDTASMCVSLTGYGWNDEEWTKRIADKSKLDEKINIYEVHLGSWRKKNNEEFCNYKDIVEELLDYVVSMGYTHIELLPLMEHPLDGSWGYQVTGYFSITSRYGTPQDFMYFVDQCHQKQIGVILDWVPVHFCRDEHGLSKFDGSTLYEYDNPIMSDNVQWGTLSFDHGKQKVIQFLISNALFWLDIYHIDGLRVDAVSYMLYLDAGRPSDKWLPNKYGGRENLNAIKFLKKLNSIVSKYYPNALMIAEESTAWPNVTGSPKIGGLGFDFKWNMGWMNDVLKYMELDPIYRKWHHHLICFSFVYACTERFILVLSHDEVVHGKKSLLNKMPGDYWSKFANLRVFYGYMIGHPGKKLLFMGSEFGQFIEWNDQKELDWMLLEYESHRQMQCFVKELNQLYRCEKSLYQLDHNPLGFEWIDSANCEESIIVFMRKAIDAEDFIIVICNFTPVTRQGYKIGVPILGEYEEVFNSDSTKYGGQGVVNGNAIKAKDLEWNNQPYSMTMAVPALSAVFLKLKK